MGVTSSFRSRHQTIDPPSTNRLRVRWAALGAAVAVTLGAGTIATVDAVQTSGERLTYVASEPCRLLNTRPGDNQVGSITQPLPGGFPVTIQARGAQGNCSAAQLPDDAKALQLNVTPVNATASTDVTIWPSGPIPQASSVNPRPGPPVPNAVVATLHTDGTFQMQNKFGTIDMVIDVLGYYVDHNHDDRYYTKAQADETFVRPVITKFTNGLGLETSTTSGNMRKVDDLTTVNKQRDDTTLRVSFTTHFRSLGVGVCQYQLRVNGENDRGFTSTTGSLRSGTSDAVSDGDDYVQTTFDAVFQGIPAGTVDLDLYLRNTLSGCFHNPGNYTRGGYVEEFLED